VTSWKSTVRAWKRNAASRSSTGTSATPVTSGRNQNAKPGPERVITPLRYWRVCMVGSLRRCRTSGSRVIVAMVASEALDARYI
jgi:hypothetical protein